jgi:hypothetical protein
MKVNLLLFMCSDMDLYHHLNDYSNLSTLLHHLLHFHCNIHFNHLLITTHITLIVLIPLLLSLTHFS